MKFFMTIEQNESGVGACARAIRNGLGKLPSQTGKL